MKVFRSQLEDILPAEELRFNPTPGFQGYKRYLSHSIAHPAKMNTKLTKFLIEKFTEKGEVVLDPMAGSGSTGVIAALNGRNAVCVDIEEKFHKWMEKARKKVERQKTFTQKGFIKNICGDARKLSKLLKDADVVVTSPPYSGTMSVKAGGASKKALEHMPKIHMEKGLRTGYSLDDENIGNLPHGSVDAIVTSPPYSESISKQSWETEKKRIEQKIKDGTASKELKRIYGQIERGNAPGELACYKGRYSKAPSNIGNLPHGKVDTIITSPPYGEAQEGSGIAKRGYQGDKHSPTDLVGKRSYMPDKFESEENISRLPMGEVDAVITSPPYAESKKGGEADEDKMAERWDKTAKERNWNTWGKTWKTEGRKRALKSLGSGYGISRPEQIGNLRFQPDAIITSPPYQHDSVVHKNRSGETRVAKEKFGYSDFYSTSKENIGNLKKETYLEAMLKVYSEMFKVLKPQGKAIIVIKPFIRNKRVVDLPYHTWLLLKKAGFKLVQLFKLRLKQESFWRILYSKKFPDVPKIKHEYILVCGKMAGGD